MSSAKTENSFVISAAITGLLNVGFFIVDYFGWYLYGFSFSAFLMEFVLGIFFFLPGSTRDVARGIIVSSAISIVVSMAACSYFLQSSL